jgi:formylglycine-generating enzyme required for sulfatase activity
MTHHWSWSLPVLACAVVACAGTRAPERSARTPTIAAGVAYESTAMTSECPDGMILVEGEYCPEVHHRCIRWADPKEAKFNDYRCAEYARPVSCWRPREHKRFCIDKFERTETGSNLPLNDQAWIDTKRICEEAGARVCLESEWTFACEGEEMRPYPYGWTRDSALCNVDQVHLTVPGDDTKILDLRQPPSAHPMCTSAFGLRDMAGNVAEWVAVDGTPPGSLVVQKGAWWHPGKHTCRAAQGGHDQNYHGKETGFRCCKDAP